MKSLENRILPPLVMIAFALLMWLASHWLGPVHFGAWRYVVGCALVLLGIAIAASGVREFRKSKTTIDPIRLHAATSLVTSGIFSFTRNPMYLGMLVLLTGTVFILGNLWLLAGPVLFAAYITRFQIIPEERVMAEKFGEAFSSYRKRVRRWI